MLVRLQKKRRLVLVSVAVVIVAAAGITIWAATRPSPAPTYRLVPASVTTLRQAVSSSGTIEPAQLSDLNFGVSGQVTAVDVTVGQQVSAGQTLATLQSASLSAAVAQAQSTLASDQAKLSSDQSNGASSAQVSADGAAITAAQNQVTNAQNALNEATMTAPIAGTVAAVDLTVGQQVSAGGGGSSAASASGSGQNSQSGGASQSGGQSGGSSSSNSGTAQIVVISTDSYVVNASVDDTEVGQVKDGDQAVVTPDGSTTPVYGTVTSVAVMASGSSSVPSYPVTIGVTGTPSGLIAGAGATVSIIVKQLTDVLAVPSAAVHYTGGQAGVEVMSGGAQVTRQITTGMTAGGLTQVLNGLSEGDQVVVTGGTAGTGGNRTGGTGGNGTGGNGTGGNGTGGNGTGGNGTGGTGGFGGRGGGAGGRGGLGGVGGFGG